MKNLLLILPLLILTSCGERKIIGDFEVMEIGACDKYAYCSTILQNKKTKQKLYESNLYRPVKNLKYRCYKDNGYTYCSRLGV